MIIKPIKIKIEDKKRFGDVAFLVDRNDFLNDLAEVRIKWDITELIPYESIHEWQDRALKANKEDNKKYQTAWDLFQDKWQLKVGDPILPESREEWWKVHRILPFWDFYFDINSLREKYHKPNFFHWIITRVLVCGEVRDKDYSTVSIIPFGASFSSGAFTGLPPSASALIQITKETTEDELLRVYRQFKKMPSQNTYEGSLFDGDAFNPDTISNIHRDREWYWQKKADLNYRQIWEQTPKRVRPATREAVIQAIKQYKLRLAAKT